MSRQCHDNGQVHFSPNDTGFNSFLLKPGGSKREREKGGERDVEIFRDRLTWSRADRLRGRQEPRGSVAVTVLTSSGRPAGDSGRDSVLPS